MPAHDCHGKHLENSQASSLGFAEHLLMEAHAEQNAAARTTYQNTPAPSAETKPANPAEAEEHMQSIVLRTPVFLAQNNPYHQKTPQLAAYAQHSLSFACALRPPHGSPSSAFGAVQMTHSYSQTHAPPL